MFREALRNGAHLGVLSAFALAQPLFEILGRNAAFFAVRGSTSREIVVFAIALVLAPPAAMLVLELGLRLGSRPAANALHLVFVGAMTSLIALQVLKRIEAIAAPAAAVGAGLVAAVATAAYARSRLVPALLTALSPAPILFLALFLFISPVSKLVLVKDVTVRTAAVRTSTPVVLVVFDELSTVSLLDRRERVDAVRYPNFAALARNSTWFRNATTVHAHTEVAVPAILTGRLPTANRLPIYSDHPRNLFTLVGRRYRMNVLETLTRLCPPELCKGGRESLAANAVASGDRTMSLVSDVSIVYLHLLLPEPLTGRLPPITDNWTNFRGRTASRAERTTGACGRQICKFTARIGASKGPSLSFLHSLLPHVPWQFLPSGLRYATDVRRIPGVEDARWTSDAWLTRQGYQRYLLQLGYTDSALGIILRRLRTTGLYDRALVIVTADHGVSFTPNEPRRLVTATNLHELAFVPLFVKLPGQRSGRIVDSFVQTIDVLPTIADVLRVRSPWRFDGRSLVRGRFPRDGSVVVRSNVSRAEERLSSLLRRRRAALAQQISAFGSGSFERVYRIGPNRDLIGTPVVELQVAQSARTQIEINGASLLRSIDASSDLVPCYLTGRVLRPANRRQALAIAINGEIAAVTRTYSAFGETRFAAMVPPTILRPGQNSVAVFAVRRVGGRRVLEQLGGDAPTFALVVREGRTVITSSDGKTIRVERGALQGAVRANLRPDSVVFGGWAVDGRARTAADSVAVFVRGSSVYTGSASNFGRPDIRKRFGVSQAGFIFELPRTLVGGDLRSTRVFAIRGTVASELPLRR